MAAVTLAAAGLSVTVVEGADLAGGGCRTEELTLPGFRHDVCSAVHPMVLVSPFFRQPAFDGLRELACASLRCRLPNPSTGAVPWRHTGPWTRRWPNWVPMGPPTGA